MAHRLTISNIMDFEDNGYQNKRPMGLDALLIQSNVYIRRSPGSKRLHRIAIDARIRGVTI